MADKKVQPKSPQHEGVDPLTTGETLHSRYDTKTEAEKLRRKEAEAKPASTEKVEQTVSDQKKLNAEENAPRSKASGSTTSSR